MSARDAAVAELAKALGLDPGAAAGIVDRIVAASADEAGARLSESLLEPLEASAVRQAQGFAGLLAKARRELAGEHG